jgi:phenylacetate-CoA ligase
MTAYNVLARHVLAPTLDVIRGTHVMRCLRELERSQWYSPKAIEELQSDRLQQTIVHAYEHVPYYRQLLKERSLTPKDIVEASDLAKLPVLTKDLVRANLQDLVADNYSPHRLLTSRTGGSTGNPLVFYTTHEDWFTHGRTRGLLAMEWADVYMGDKVATFPSTFGRPTRKERALQPVIRHFQRTVIIGENGISEDTLPEIIKSVTRSSPRAIAAYPSTLALLARHIRDSGVPAPYVHAVLTGGEQILDDQRTLIRDVFGKEPFSRYGSHENALLGTECEQHSGFHMFAQDLAIEIADDEGTPMPPGNTGHVLVTNLRARGMPFIRYDTGDIGAWAAERCPCGRGMPLLSGLVGRSCDFILTPSGKQVSGTAVGLSRMAPLGVSGVQIIQEELASITVRLVLPFQACDENKRTVCRGVEDILHHTLGDDMRIDITFVDHIEPTPAGKYVPVVSKLTGSERPRWQE